jgi:hypothetical protein
LIQSGSTSGTSSTILNLLLAIVMYHPQFFASSVLHLCILKTSISIPLSRFGLLTLWFVGVEFVDLPFGIHKMMQALA